MNKFERLINIETEFDLSSLVIDRVWIYPILKQNLYVFYLSGNRSTFGLSKKSSLANKLLQVNKWHKKNKELKQYDILIVDNANSRRLSNTTQLYESAYSDYLHSLFNDHSVITFERPGEAGEIHYLNIPQINVIYPDAEILKAIIKARFIKKKYDLSGFSVFQEIIKYLKVDQSILNFSSEKLARFFLFYEYYKSLLEVIKPKVIIFITAYNYANMAFVLSAKRLGIPTVELQHGFIRHDHPGYIYKNVLAKELFPDYILTYGDYFTGLLANKSVLFDKDKIFTCGSYSTEKAMLGLIQKLNSKKQSKKIIYITSQWSIRDKLKLFVLKLSELLPENYKIVYKTHPLETETDKFYQEFKNKNNIELVTDSKINSLELLPDAFVHSTAYSTSFMEAHFMEKPNIFIHIEGFSQVIESFVDNQTLFMAHTPKEYLKKLLMIEKDHQKIASVLKQQKGKFYKPNAGKNIKETITKIIDG